MIISNEKKFIYLRVPKTGSTSVSVYLYENLPLEKSIIRVADNSIILKKEEFGNIKENYFTNTIDSLPGGVHATLDQIIDARLLEYPLDNYTIYAVCRNPVERYLSFQNMIKKVDNKNIEDSFSLFKSYLSMFEASPQSQWLTYNKKLINRVFLYENIHQMIAEIAKKYNVHDTSNFSDYSYRRYEKKVLTISPKAMNYISTVWHDDFTLYNRLKNQNF